MSSVNHQIANTDHMEREFMAQQPTNQLPMQTSWACNICDPVITVTTSSYVHAENEYERHIKMMHSRTHFSIRDDKGHVVAVALPPLDQPPASNTMFPMDLNRGPIMKQPEGRQVHLELDLTHDRYLELVHSYPEIVAYITRLEVS